jgi:hypothetical protein
MSLLQKFDVKSPEDKIISMDDWIATLPNDQQEEFYQARKRQLARRQKAIDNGHLIVVEDGYAWTDQETFKKKSHGVDRIWYSYFHRWLIETNQEFTETITETK